MSQKYLLSAKEINTVLRRVLTPKTSEDVIRAIVEDFHDELEKLLTKKGKRW